MAKKMTMKAYEKTAQDKKSDKKEAKKRHMSVAEYERSEDDERKDKAAVRKINKRRK